MTAAQFRARLEALSWTQRGLAERLGVSYTTVHRWAQDQARIPAGIGEWLDDIIAYIRKHPPPSW